MSTWWYHGIRAIFVPAILAAAVAVLASPSHAQIVIEDVAGRTVEMAAPARRIILEGPAYYTGLALISDQAAELIVGVGGTAHRGFFEAERDLAGKPHVGTIANHTFSIEKALSLQPDLLIAALSAPGQQSAVENAFANAGIPVLYVDFLLDPADNTLRSMDILGRAIGESDKAAAFAQFYAARRDQVMDRLADRQPPFPRLYMAGLTQDATCCWSFGNGFMTPFFAPLRIADIASGQIAGLSGQLSLEYVIAQNPDLIIASDRSYGPEAMFGRGETAADSKAILQAFAQTPGLMEVQAARDVRVHGIDLTLMRTPLNILAIELFAKWSHPELFSDLDPQSTLDTINERFLAKPLKGPFWVSLGARPEGIDP